MQGNYTIGTVRKLTILNQLKNPVDGYQIAFTWTDDRGAVRQSQVKVEEAGASSEAVDIVIRAEIDRIESWMR